MGSGTGAIRLRSLSGASARRTRGRLNVAFLVLISITLPGASTERSAAQSGAAPYEAAEGCGECHAAIHQAWSASPHAQSATNPVYLESLDRAAEVAGGKAAARRACVWYHAPTTLVTNDLDLNQPISQEGITCDFCHTVKDVDLEKDGHPFLLEPGGVKRGPFEYAEPVAHETAFSSLHRYSPLLCASCHEFTNGNGVPILSTYTEWKEGPYPARGVPCQGCHMALVPGRVTAGGTEKEGSARVVNLHRLVGGSSRGQLDTGLDLVLKSVRRSAGRVELTVEVANVAAGHAVPGGLSTKTLVLSAGVESGDETLQHIRSRRYRREIEDADGRVLKTVPDLFLKGASVGLDNRIRPRESRTERFNLPIPAGARAIVVRLEYEDASDPRIAPVVIRITEVREQLDK